MGKCLLFHKWNGCKCEKCGETRKTGHDFKRVEGQCYEKCSVCGERRQLQHKWKGNQCEVCGKYNPAKTTCDKCGKSLEAFNREADEFYARMKAMGAGLVLGGPGGGLLKCRHCGKIACTRCALELPGHTEKTCPFCNEDYGWGDVVE